jgi:hypothetical protein
MKTNQVQNNQLSFSFPDYPARKIIKTKTVERSRDSEGKYCSELDLPKNKNDHAERERRRAESISRLLRTKDEEIVKLKEELKKYKN